MIESFKHKGLKKLYDKGDRSGIRSDIADKAELYLSILDTAQSLEKLDCKGFSLHRLTGNMKDWFSVWVSRNHRIIFLFENETAFDVDLVDYH